jgi:hypothetical protein
MKRGSILFLRTVVVLVAAGVLCFLIWQPQAEGVNQGADLATIYLDPFVLYMYLGSLPFFFALHQVFELLGYVGQLQGVSPAAVTALRRIKHSAWVFLAFLVGGMAYIMLAGSEDGAGPVALGIMTSFVCVVTAAAAATFERVLQRAVDLKLENDLTV